jgi:hypothetical protein
MLIAWEELLLLVSNLAWVTENRCHLAWVNQQNNFKLLVTQCHQSHVTIFQLETTHSGSRFTCIQKRTSAKKKMYSG